jgi:hypothetical protein
MTPSTKNTWLINGLLTVIAVLLVAIYLHTRPIGAARAAGQGWATDDTMVLQLRAATERLVLVDTNKKQIMIYNEKQNGKFGLSGAHSYKYDIEMVDTENANPKPPYTYFDAKKMYDEGAKK